MKYLKIKFYQFFSNSHHLIPFDKRLLSPWIRQNAKRQGNRLLMITIFVKREITIEITNANIHSIDVTFEKSMLQLDAKLDLQHKSPFDRNQSIDHILMNVMIPF